MTEFLDGKYEIIAVLAENAMSTIYRARHIEMDRHVAAKVMRAELANDERAFQRFRQEIRAVTSFQHQNIVAVLDCGICPDGRPYLIMELLQGATLSQLIKDRGALDWTEALEIFRQIAAALAYAHEAGIIHRDVKPSNVFVMPDKPRPRVVVIDFGIAAMTVDQTTGSNPSLTTAGAVIGTTLYMSPEQCTGQRIDFRSDLYSLGCLMYETLTGAPPFCHDSALATMNSHVCDSPKPPKSPDGKPVIPGVVSSIVLQALKKNPDRRQQSAAALYAQLSGLLSESGRHTAFITSIPHWLNASLVWVLLVASAAILGAALMWSHYLPTPPARAQQPLADESTWNQVQQLPPRYFHNYKHVRHHLRAYADCKGHRLRFYGLLMARRLAEETSRHFGPDSREHTRALAVQAEIYESCGNRAGAIALFRKIVPRLTASKDAEDQILRYDALVNLSELLDWRQVSESTCLLKQAEVLSKNMSLARQIEVFRSLSYRYYQCASECRNLGKSLQMKSYCLESMDYADQGMKLMGDGCPAMRASLVECKANCAILLHDFKQALNLFRSNVECMETTGMTDDLALTYVNSMAGMGKCALAMGDLKLSASAFNELFSQPDIITDANLPTMKEAAQEYAQIIKTRNDPAELDRSIKLYNKYDKRLLAMNGGHR